MFKHALKDIYIGKHSRQLLDPSDVDNKYKELPIGQCKECKRENSLLFKKHGCPVKNPRNKTEEEND